MLKKNLKVNGSEVLVLGFTFKENCPDVRNTKVVDVVRNLEDYGINVSIFDPWANPDEVMHEYGLKTSTKTPFKKYEAVVLAFSHKDFEHINIKNLLSENGIIYDVKGILKQEDCVTRL
jgi:UDP-N-acetyl-D-galactosamine dehydrogenase